MNRVLAVALGGLVLMGCDRAAKSAERQYEMVSGVSERCEMASKVADAWLASENQPKYDEWKSRAEVDCAMARVSRGSAY